ncbi:sigma-70 family RNA polymerase sigma factor [Leptolyngbyaceae cyanobacterium CCMR0082]|uniref:Sigma-70 family RNA polymerase sigma factor n=2 Tax=Adonisia turfae TaxID=2950184 RepID=A0A6M0S1Q4_9CYAN|nr:sigma-70 family RNA polymerase sigma factor [Adonisia turfae]MDV3353010.1 sigma-70 family RNA polymerase sigma factor [Leptothoe sp. LEGE 181152]NEZ59529.1 sigma-70 family RNA polymerase sigma factor [Adonisia turfae CCMR0081]NEZ62409.1 sigma-70 family RNA polymerase sigma factor [Adonisia turfae CCMR0082]
MNDSPDELRRLACEACCHHCGSAERQRYLTQLIRLVKPRLWYDHSAYYQDALQQTWIYLCQNLCEGKTAKPYDPEIASVVTWLNAYLKFRLLDFEQLVQADRKRYISAYNEEGGTTAIVEKLTAKPEIPPILERVQDWLEQNMDELCRIHIANHPTINCYEMIRRRLPPETPWHALEKEFDVSYKTLESFYRRQCKPRLREFGRAEGHLNS